MVLVYNICTNVCNNLNISNMKTEHIEKIKEGDIMNVF